MNLPLKHFLQVLCLAVFFASFFCFKGIAQQKKQQIFIGKLVNGATKQPVTYGMAYNISSKLNTSSDSTGYFNIFVSSGDTIMISRIGYFQKELVITDSLFKLKRVHIIELTERAYELKGVDISGLGTYDQFKYKVIHTDIPSDTFIYIDPSIREALKEKVVVLNAQASIPIGSPVTALYNLLSKEGKSYRKLSKELEKEKEADSYGYKYSPEIVSGLTGLKELELEKFMRYCSLQHSFIVNANEYEIAERILNCFKLYNEDAAKNATKTDSIK